MASTAARKRAGRCASESEGRSAGLLKKVGYGLGHGRLSTALDGNGTRGAFEFRRLCETFLWGLRRVY